jgi:hypothetical protein
MPFKTLSSGLTVKIPTAGTKNWSATLESENWQKISEHDHTGSGKGKQIGTNAISSLAVTEAKIADGAVSTAKLGTISISASQIASNAVTTAKILDGNVTLAKIANMTSDRILGRDTAGSGAPEELTVGGGLEFSGAGGIRRSALSGDVNVAAGSATTTIQPGVVLESMLATGAVTAAKIASSEIAKHTELMRAFGNNVQGSQTGTIMSVAGPSGVEEIVMPYSGSVTALTINLADVVIAGSLTVSVYKNGALARTATAMTSGTRTYQTITPVTFVAGDYLEVRYDCSSLNQSGSAGGVVALWGVIN